MSTSSAYNHNTTIEKALQALNEGRKADAARLAELATVHKPEDAEGWSILGIALAGQSGAGPKARAALQKALDLEPEEPRWHLHLGQGLMAMNDPSAAERVLAIAVEKSNGHPQALVLWADSLMAISRFKDAAQIYLQVLKTRPRPNIWIKMGDALVGAKDTVNAAIAYERAYPDDQRPAYLNAALADMHITLNQYDRAEHFNTILLSQNPDDADAGMRAANLRRWRGDHAGAIATQKAVLAKSPEHPELIAALLDDGETDVLSLAEKLAANEALQTTARRRITFALARHFDTVKDEAKAWHFAALGNSLYEDGETVDGLKPEYKMLEKALEVYRRMPNVKVGETASDLPAIIYIMGPPRVGGSLLQTIFSRAEGIASAGERAALMSWIPEKLDAPDNLAEIADQLRQADLAGMTSAHGEAACFVDKTPQHVFVAGVLSRIHPGAVFINPFRNPGDMAVSMYFHDFGPGFTYTRKLADIQAYLEFQAHAVQAWRAAGLSIIDHDHDAFINDPDTQGAALFEKVGSPWTPDVLETGASDNVVKTFSARQVRGGVTQKFAGRGERYQAFLETNGFEL